MELTVVVILVLISAAMVAPGISSLLQNRSEKDFIAKWERMMVKERSRARTEKQTRTLRFDEAAGSFHEDDDANNFVQLPENSTVTASRVDAKDVPADSWTVKFYADGTASASDITVDVNGNKWSLEITKRGEITLQQKELGEAESPEWEAGEFERRA